MQNSAAGGSGPAQAEELAPGADGHDAAEPGQARPRTGQAPPRSGPGRPRSGPGGPQGPGRPRPQARRRSRLGVYVAGGVLGLAIGFGVGAFALAGSGGSPAVSASAIPSPPPTNQKFVEDEDGTGADSQANILEATAPGMVHIVSSSGSALGVGVVLTRSGIVATSGQVLRGAGSVTVQVVLSGKSFAAHVVGTDAAADLALLQIRGGSTFKTIAVGNSDDVSLGSTVTAVGSSGTAKTFTLHIGNVISRNGAATVAGTRLAGLLEATAQVLPAEDVGGPVVNLSGQAVGIDVAGAGSGLHHVGFAVPINQALAAAAQIDAQHS